MFNDYMTEYAEYRNHVDKELRELKAYQDSREQFRITVPEEDEKLLESSL